MKRFVLAALLAPLLLPGCATPERDHWTRAQFANALHRVEFGMSQAEVRRRIGEPDDILTEADLPPNTWSGKFVTWCYGTTGHDTLPALGQVCFDADLRVTDTAGGHGSDPGPHHDFKDHPNPPDPPSTKTIRENELRAALETIDRMVRHLRFGRPYDPLCMIRTVNALQPLGLEKALAAIQEYQRLCEPMDSNDAGTSLEYLLKVLIDVPDGAIPDPPGQWTSVEDMKREPRHPMTLIDDIPLYIGQAGGGTGPPPNVFALIRFYRQHGRMRPLPLRPTDRPVQALRRAFDGDDHRPLASIDLGEFAETAIPLGQLLWLLDSVYRDPTGKAIEPDDMVPSCDTAAEVRLLTDLDRLDIRWDVNQQKYVFRDGSSLPEIPTINRPRQYWSPAALEKYSARLCVKRDHVRRVWVALEWEMPDPNPTNAPIDVDNPPQVTLECYAVRVSCSGERLFDFYIPDRPPSAGAPSSDDNDTMTEYITSYSERVSALSEFNNMPDVMMRLEDGLHLNVVVVDAEGVEVDRMEFNP